MARKGLCAQSSCMDDHAFPLGLQHIGGKAICDVPQCVALLRSVCMSHMRLLLPNATPDSRDTGHAVVRIPIKEGWITRHCRPTRTCPLKKRVAACNAFQAPYCMRWTHWPKQQKRGRSESASRQRPH